MISWFFVKKYAETVIFLLFLRFYLNRNELIISNTLSREENILYVSRIASVFFAQNQHIQ